MKLKLLSLIPMLGLTASAPVASMTTSNVATLNAKIDKNQLRMDKLSVVKSINKACDNALRYDLDYTQIYDINSCVSVEENEPNAQQGWIERENLFDLNYEIHDYDAYYRYKSNNVERDNRLSYGNAKKYKLIVTVPAHAEEYKVEVVAHCKLKNCVNGCDKYFKNYNRSFMQGNLSKLSTNPEDTLLPSMGLTDYEHKFSRDHNFKIINQDSFLFDFYQNIHSQRKPYIKCELHNDITLCNKTDKPVDVSVYFWYGFFGGGYTNIGAKSHINCSEVTFSARHITK